MTPRSFLLATLATTQSASAFVSRPSSLVSREGDLMCRPYCVNSVTTLDGQTSSRAIASSCRLNMAEGTDKAAPMVNGEELEAMLQEWDTPLVVDAYATWCGPCLLMAPEFEAAAKELEGKVRFVKLDTDLEPQMAGRLNIMGLPTLLFLDKNDDAEAVEEGKAPVAVLKERIEGALRKKSIIDLCNYHFFGGPMPQQIM